ncbi:hypothetical protein [Sphingosinicella sp. CPCC 101087]|uniref:hypothetical protein n=1 Tax=Sphingosinicella sp. CPCC 101087 TaxID=2497754 RepID=UPI00101C90AF|nr:hypothetical protein [Sphingosinicella sp. CPCC 101087]
MRAATATAGMVSAAVLLAPGCGSSPESSTSRDEPVRRATFRSLAARDHLATCSGGSRRPETLYQVERLEELKQLAARKEAAQAVWLGENDWAGVARYARREPCKPSEAAYADALAEFSGSLDRLAGRIAEYPPQSEKTP